jgi:spermidine/putrescine transport system substrate-binding protein
LAVFLAICLVTLPGCTGAKAGMAKELVYRDWEGAIPRSVLDAFTKEYGTQVLYQPYETQEEVVEEIRAGKVFDVVVLENQFVQGMIAEKRLAEVNYKNVPNFKNISANFRDMAYDPRNTHSIPYSWGTTGLVVRTDLVSEPVTSWKDLWKPDYAGKLNGWILPRYMIGLALKSLGYSLNSENPAELEQALEQLILLKPHIRLLEWETAVSAPYLVSGDVVIALGQADDVLVGQEENENIAYVLPKEGGIMWGDNWTIPANSTKQETAEAFINFLLRPEISAQIINETYYWLPNDDAIPLVNSEIRNNPAVFPSTQLVENAEILLALSPEGTALYDDIWARFLAAGSQ